MMGKRNNAIGKSLKPHDYNGWDNETKVCHFLQVIKITKLEAVTNVAHAKILMQLLTLGQIIKKGNQRSAS